MASPPLSKVFVSSTYDDVLDYCHATIEALTACWMIPQLLAPPINVAMLENRLEALDKCEYYLLLVAHRYGWQPPSAARSFLEIEYDAAANKPRHCFIIDRDYPWSLDQYDAGPAYRRLTTFKRLKLKRNAYSYTFTDLPSLEIAIIRACLPLNIRLQTNRIQLAEYVIDNVTRPRAMDSDQMKLTLLLNTYPVNLSFLSYLSQHLGIKRDAIRVIAIRQNVVQLALPTEAATHFTQQFFEQSSKEAAAIPAGKKKMALNPDSLSEHLRNFDWLEDNIDQLHEAIARDIANDHTAVNAIQSLLLVMPFVSTRADLSRWEPVLVKAMVHAQVLKDVDSQIQLWSYLGMCLFRSGKHKSAIDAFNQGLERIDQWVTPEINLTARIGMLHGQSFFHSYDIDTFVKETIRLARQVNDETLLARLHFKLAIAYLHRARTVVALGHAQTAYAYWANLQYAAEQDRALLVMAEVCRVAGRYQLSKYYLGRSLSRYTSLFQSATANYHDGAIAYMNAKYAEAQIHLEKALAEYEEIGDFPYLTGAAHHALGLTYTRRGAFPAAQRSLRQAMVVWLQLDNLFEQANALYAIGFLEQYQGHYESAQEYYLDALDRLGTLPASPLIDDLRENINENREQLPE